MDWARACKESPENRTPCTSDFAEAGPFNEMVVMGVLAVRLQALNKELEWDGEKMEFIPDISFLLFDLFFDKKWSDEMSASDFAKELIKHEYRDGWSLPDMPA